MSHYNVEYDPTDPAADAKAIADIKEYLGDRAWRRLHNDLIGNYDPKSIPRERLVKEWLPLVRLACSFAGVRGFPVGALERLVIKCLASD